MQIPTWLAILACTMLLARPALGQEPRPAAQYWMSVSTESMTVPGLAGVPAGIGGAGGILGAMGMGGPGGGPRRSLMLDLLGPSTPPAPRAEHLIPPGLKMGASLPLATPAPAPGGRAADGEGARDHARIVLYWGCGETVRAGQPRVLDTATMSAEDYRSVLVARGGAQRFRLSPRQGWTYGEWPNRERVLEVPADGSLQGAHLVRGSYTPDIAFTLDARRDFMDPVVFTRAAGGLGDAIALEWRSVPTAIGYFAMAAGGSDKKKEVVIWTSSEVQDMGGGLLTYLPSATVRTYVQDRVVLAPTVTTCTIPRGIFQGADGAALQFIAYGDELNLAHPPRPADPAAPWHPIWTARVRLRSTGMLVLGQDGATAAHGPGPERPGAARPAPEAQPQTAPQPPAAPPAGSDPVKDALEGARRLRQRLGF